MAMCANVQGGSKRLHLGQGAHFLELINTRRIIAAFQNEFMKEYLDVLVE